MGILGIGFFFFFFNDKSIFFIVKVSVFSLSTNTSSQKLQFKSMRTSRWVLQE